MSTERIHDNQVHHSIIYGNPAFPLTAKERAGAPSEDTLRSLKRLREAILSRLRSSHQDLTTENGSRKRKRDEKDVQPENISFMEALGLDGVQALSDKGDLNTRLVDTITQTFSKPLGDCSVQQRHTMAESLARVPCFLAHQDMPCINMSTEEMPSVPPELLPLYVHASICLLAGPQQDITTQIWLKLLRGMLKAVFHSDSATVLSVDRDVVAVIKRGMERSERTVRVAAGKIAVTLVARSQDSGNSGLTRANAWVSLLVELIEGQTKPSIKETALSTLGSVGSVVKTKLEGRVFACLLTQLAHENGLLRAIAYSQLQSLAKLRGVSPYNLLAPYIPQISIILVEKLVVAPQMLSETCQLISLTHNDFLSLTLAHTLPSLIASGRRDVLNIISKNLNKSIAGMALEHVHEILAHLFLCPTEVQTDAGVDFLLGVVSEAAGKGAVVPVTTLIKSSMVPLLSEVVMVLGDEDAGRVRLATEALKKLERRALVPAKGQRRAPVSDLSLFLKSHMLGIISHLTDVLHDMQGKKSPLLKRQVIRSLGSLIELVGPSISSISPQIMATLHGALHNDALREAALVTWRTFVTKLSPVDVGPYIGQTSAAFVTEWSNFSPVERELANHTLDHIVEHGDQFPDHVRDMVSMQGIPDLTDLNRRLVQAQAEWDTMAHLHKLLDRATNENSTVTMRALEELKAFLCANRSVISGLSSGDTFDPIIGDIVKVLLAASSRDGDASEALRAVAYECLGVLGAMDPDRFDMPPEEVAMVVLHNFDDEDENIAFTLHLIRDLLVGAFRSTSDTKYQNHLAFVIQELLKVCHFGPELVIPGATSSISNKVRSRWNSLPKSVLETVTPLLEGRFTLNNRSLPPIQHPVYPDAPTYREWIQVWTAYLIARVSGPAAKRIFEVFRSAVRNQDVGVAHHLLPHIVLNVLLTGDAEDCDRIRLEIISVLEDQVNPRQGVAADRRMLCAQTVFSLMDHISKWIRLLRQHTNQRRLESGRYRHGGNVTNIGHEAEEQLIRVESLLSSIDQELVARAALNCKYFARSLLSFEQRIVSLKATGMTDLALQPYYESLHQMYAELDEPDGMAGVSTLVLSPSLEHQIREHEAIGAWTSAQSCWEVKLQGSPDDLASHIGLLRCLRNLGHYDTLRTHVKGVLTRKHEWTNALTGFQIEGAWFVGDWSDVEALSAADSDASELFVARLLLAIRKDNAESTTQALGAARKRLGDKIMAAGKHSYRGSYDVVIGLHVLHELEMICIPASRGRTATLRSGQTTTELTDQLARRFDAVLPTFRAREPIQSIRRTAFGIRQSLNSNLTVEIGKSWLTTARIARKAGHIQTAYSATLQARKFDAPFAFVQTCKLLRATAEPIRALKELENAMVIYQNTPIDLTEERPVDTTPDAVAQAKAFALQARWMEEADRFSVVDIANKFSEASKRAPRFESPYFHLGHFWDRTYAGFSVEEKLKNAQLPFNTCKAYGKALSYGSKYIYQTMPRMLTLWLDMADHEGISLVGHAGDATQQTVLSIRDKITDTIDKIQRRLPAWQWLTAFPQLVSRIIHPSPSVFQVLLKIMSAVLIEYPQQALWLLTSASKSKRPDRAKRCQGIYSRAQSAPGPSRDSVAQLIGESVKMTSELLNLADYNLPQDQYTMSISKQCRELRKLTPSHLMLPLQESMIVTLPPASANQDQHKPFPRKAPIIIEFLDEIEIMKSLAKPRKISIRADDGRIYWFLCKPKDDLRKDARLMDFNSMINKLLKKDSESRRRQLHIRTYGVIPLNEECGLVEWVPNTIGLRHILAKCYEARKMKIYNNDIGVILDKERYTGNAGKAFETQILPTFPPVFHEWFLSTFPEPTAWLSSRLAYGRTAAVMSMVGYVLGLGDRHGENILFDSANGDAVHVDFNCLFEKGKTLEVPERVPFRLTQNMVDGLGITGVEGVFRIACELTMDILRNHKDSLMSVLEAFVHDPLSEFEEEKRRQDQQARKGPARRGTSTSTTSADGRALPLRELAMRSLQPIESKLKGQFGSKQMTTRNQVDSLIREATNSANLGMMYAGWAAWL